jgi:hypothetical protein
MLKIPRIFVITSLITFNLIWTYRYPLIHIQSIERRSRNIFENNKNGVSPEEKMNLAISIESLVIAVISSNIAY